ncbi:MAG: hypothetical protein AB1629_02705 [Candidatus Omnitrophota bacterium]
MNKIRFKFISLILVIFLAVFIVGCAWLKESGKKLWGSSTQALEKARSQGKAQVFECSLSACFDECLNIMRDMKATVFAKDKRRGVLIAMDFKVKDVIDTTELGIFFTKSENLTKVEITSLNPVLIDEVGPKILSGLEKKFSIVN